MSFQLMENDDEQETTNIDLSIRARSHLFGSDLAVTRAITSSREISLFFFLLFIVFIILFFFRLLTFYFVSKERKTLKRKIFSLEVKHRVFSAEKKCVLVIEIK